MSRQTLPGSRRYLLPESMVISEIESAEAVPITFMVAVDSDRLRADADRMVRTAIRDRIFLTRDQLRAAYPPNPDGIAAVEAFARNHRLELLPSHSGDHLRHLIVPADKATGLFGVDLKLYTDCEGRVYRGRSGDIALPGDDFNENTIKTIRGIFGLDNRCQAQRKKVNANSLIDLGGGGLADPFALPGDLTGENQTVGILEFGGDISEATLPEIFGGIAATRDAHVVAPRKFVPTRGVDVINEAKVDGQVVKKLLPKSTVVFYSLPDTDQGWIMGLQHILFDDHHAPNVLAVCWGYPELQTGTGAASWTCDAIHAIEDLLARAVLLGVTVCCATGDNGVNGWPPGVNYPASSRYVLSCGGTMFNGPDEVVWSNALGATGGGISDVIQIPDWQLVGSIKATSAGFPRPAGALHGGHTPDVAGYASFTPSNMGEQWGTSTSTPRWAALVAAVNQRIQTSGGTAAGNITGLFYDQSTGLQAACNDIVQVDNACPPLTGNCYQATCEWDACTGWGTPIVEKLIDAFVKNALPVSERSSSGPQGGAEI
jgi:kumamolisin